MNTIKLLKTNSDDYQLPIFLSTKVDIMGGLVSFDGGIEQVEQVCNFTYIQNFNVVTLFLTTNTTKVNEILEVVFTVSWGDGSFSQIDINNNQVTKTYNTLGEYKISLSFDTPWKKQKIEKIIQTNQNLNTPNPFGTIENFLIPYSDKEISLNYLNDLDYTNYNKDATFSFIAMGSSRISEKKLYGSENYSGITFETTQEGIVLTGYTIDNLVYKDYPDGFTTIVGSTSNYEKEVVFNNMLTRNEHFIGFIDEPTIYSDVFIERGKQGVIEKTLRLSEVNNIGELMVYGNEYFNVIKQ